MKKRDEKGEEKERIGSGRGRSMLMYEVGGITCRFKTQKNTKVLHSILMTYYQISNDMCLNTDIYAKNLDYWTNNRIGRLHVACCHRSSQDRQSL